MRGERKEEKKEDDFFSSLPFSGQRRSVHAYIDTHEMLHATSWRGKKRNLCFNVLAAIPCMQYYTYYVRVESD